MKLRQPKTNPDGSERKKSLQDIPVIGPIAAALVWGPVMLALWIGHKCGKVFRWDG